MQPKAEESVDLLKTVIIFAIQLSDAKKLCTLIWLSLPFLQNFFFFRLALHVPLQWWRFLWQDSTNTKPFFASGSSSGRLNCVVAVAAQSVRGFIHYQSSTRGLRKVDMPQPDMIMKEILICADEGSVNGPEWVHIDYMICLFMLHRAVLKKLMLHLDEMSTANKIKLMIPITGRR